jgi:Ca2+-binding EF-hand superfamily protein
MTKNKWLLVSVLSTVAGVGVAAAQPGAGKHFEKLDTDGNGVVTSAEFEASFLTRFNESDANKDGKVTAEEMKAKHAAHEQERFTQMDTNKNGVIERAEIERMPEEHFARIDADKSGTLTQAELANGHPKHEGKGPGELKGLHGDTNNDGVVTKAEAQANVQQLVKKIDADGDGKLTQEELAKGHPGHGGHHGRGGAECGGKGHDKGATKGPTKAAAKAK